jgi:acetyl-CoA C-acetyltransferase
VTTPSFTVNQACASGLKSILLAAQSIALGSADVVVAGGMESMSNTPYMLPTARWGARLGHAPLIDLQYRDGFLCPLCGDMMGRTAERLAEQYEIGRREQDEYAVESQRRAQQARREGWFEREIVPVDLPGRRGPTTLSTDEHARDDVTLEDLARLRPVFKDDGTVHPGNSSGITDGAAAVVVMSAPAAAKYGAPVQGRLLAASQAGVDPAIMGIGPVPAVRELLERTGIDLADIDLIELNEAFAAQVIAVQRDLGLDLRRTNVGGGAIALGHPIGCTGTRIVVTLLHALERLGLRSGLATLCVSGGMGTSLLLERSSS